MILRVRHAWRSPRTDREAEAAFWVTVRRTLLLHSTREVEPKPTNQHYVPQFLLRNFGSGRGKQIFVLDKASGEIYQKPINKVASGRGFYDYEVDGAQQSLDPLLTKMENVSSRIISRFVGAQSLRVLSDTGRKMVAVFAAVQKLRTNARRKELKGVIDGVYAAVKKHGPRSEQSGRV